MQHHEQRVRGIALRDQNLPAHQILTDHGAKRLQALFRTERSKQRELLQRVAPRKWGAPLTHFWRDRLDCVRWMLAPPGLRGEEYKGRSVHPPRRYLWKRCNKNGQMPVPNDAHPR